MSSDLPNSQPPAPSADPSTAAASAELLPPAPGAAPADLVVSERDSRLDKLRLQMDVRVRVHSLRVADLLSLARGSVVESEHNHTQDVPVRCDDVVLMWAEFEVIDQKLAVRITRVA